MSKKLPTQAKTASEVAKSVADTALKLGAKVETAQRMAVLAQKSILIRHMAKIRTMSKLTQEQLAERSGMPVSWIIKIEELDDQEKLTLGEFRQYVEGLGLKAVVRIERCNQLGPAKGG